MSNQITPNPSVPSQVVQEVKFPKFVNNLGIIPTSYKDSMSYYECLAWLCKYLEETVIPTLNQNGEAVEELQGLYIELNSYVTHYFDTLDVQEEINNKLDEMTTTGVLQSIINQYFENVNAQLNAINNKVNDITSGSPAGVYSTYADLVSANPPHGKIYVVSSTGKWYYYDTDNTEWAEGGTYLSNLIGISEVDVINENNSITENKYNKYNVSANRGGIDTTTGEVVSSNNRCYFDIDTTTIDVIEPYLNIVGFTGMEFSVIGLYFDDNYMGTIPASHLTSFADGFKFRTLWAANKFRFIFRKPDNTNFSDEEVANLKMYIFDDVLKINTIDYCELLKNTINIPVELGGYNSSGVKIESEQYARSYKIKLQKNKKRYIHINLEEGYRIHYIVKWNNGKIVERQNTINPSNLLGSYNHVLIDNTSQNFNEISFIFAYTENNQLQSTIPDTYQSDIEIIKTKEFGKYENLIYDAMGDSITYGFIPRNYTGYPGQLVPYGELVAEKLGLIFENFGISGSSVAVLPDRDPMCQRYNSLNDEATFISVMGGTNDIRNGVQVGTIDSTDTSTFYGALKEIAQGLYDKYFINQGTTKGKTKKIFFITPIKLLQSSSGVIGGTGTNYDMSAWCKAIKDVGEMFSIPVLDLYNLSQINPALSQTIQGTIQGYTGTYNPYITDGTHPTQEGQELIANIVAGFMESL